MQSVVLQYRQLNKLLRYDYRGNPVPSSYLRSFGPDNTFNPGTDF